MNSLCIFFTLFFASISAQAIPFESKKMAFAGPNPNAIVIAEKIARQGGNVADVAVAMGFALSVTSPYFASLGGGGFAMIHFNGKTKALDFRETAPSATHPEFYLQGRSSTQGGAAVGTPGVVAGLWEIHQKYGRLPWKKLVAESIQLADNGFIVSGDWWKRTKRVQKKFSPETYQHIFKKGQYFYEPGDRLKQPGLAKALHAIQKHGPKGFYQGEVAEDLVSSVKKNGGVISLDDLKKYKVRWLTPLKTNFAGYQIDLMPPPSSGGVVIFSALKLIEKTNLSKHPAQSIQELHFLSEILSRSFRGRINLADPDFHKNPIAKLTSEKYINELAQTISSKKTKKLKPLKEIKTSFKESNETTHYSVMDREGNAIALTVTLNGNYGSGVFTKKYGIALNNEMDDFTTRPGKPNMFGLIQGNENQVEPGKRPLSSMSPTLVKKNGKVVMSLGSPGGPKIISAVLQVLYRTLITGLDMDAAIQSPRLHHQFLPHKVLVDKNKFSPDVLKGLRLKGHVVEPSWSAKVYGVRKNKNGFLEAAFDARGEGGAGGI